MTVRDSNAIHAAEILGEVPFTTLVRGLYDAVAECEVEGIEEPQRDPAVMVFGAFIAFHTHCDVNTRNGYMALLEMCRARHSEPEIPQ